MTPEQEGQLQQQLYALQTENAQLRQQLAQLAQHQQARSDRRSQVVRGGGRLLIPLLDRHKVVRSFGALAETAGGFCGPSEQWPTRDALLGDTRRFLESLTRFAVRRRTLLMMLAILGAVIPAIQLWLVVQQNEIIENQNTIVREQKDLSEIQVYDIVARSMTEGDRNAKLMTGALLSRARPQFLEGVVQEAFDPVLATSFGSSSYNAAARRLEDAAFRGHVLRAAVQGIHRRAAESSEDAAGLADRSLPSLHRILQDSSLRVPEVIRLGTRTPEGGRVDEALDEEVEGYLLRVGEAMRLYARIARTSGREAELWEDLQPLLRRIDWAALPNNRFRRAHAFGLEMLLVDLAVAPAVSAPLHGEPNAASLSRDEALARGLEVLRDGLGEEGIDWSSLGQEAKGR